ncbi:MAG: FAD-binding oxidoreductase [Candidatus Acidiferrales bacterium]
MPKPIEDLHSSLHKTFNGSLFRPGEPEFAAASGIWNGMVARTPGLIARCADVADVQAAIRSAAAAGVITAVRCGGHSLAGFSTCEGGLVIDLSRMRQVTVDEKNRVARAAGGCLLGSIDTATQEFGLVYPAGVVSHTGAAGLILGGGTGWLMRLFGLSCDNVLGFRLVTADGSLVRADETENPELFWALRGGGGNFGVVTEFELKLHPLNSVMLSGGLCFNENIPSVLRYWRDFMADAPDELKWNISLVLAPHGEEVPSKLRGRPALSESIVWFGDEQKGRKYMEHILSLGHPVAVTHRTISFLELQTLADKEFPHGRRYYTKSGFFKFLSDDTIERMVDSLASIPSPRTQIELAYMGGAAGRIGPHETAFGDRSAPFVMNLLADWSDPSEDAANIQWVRSTFKELRPAMKPGVYVNFMSGDEDDRVKEAYSLRWDRLVAVKTHYDPGNFFRLNQNIPPLGSPKSA